MEISQKKFGGGKIRMKNDRVRNDSVKNGSVKSSLVKSDSVKNARIKFDSVRKASVIKASVSRYRKLVELFMAALMIWSLCQIYGWVMFYRMQPASGMVCWGILVYELLFLVSCFGMVLLSGKLTFRKSYGTLTFRKSCEEVQKL